MTCGTCVTRPKCCSFQVSCLLPPFTFKSSLRPTVHNVSLSSVCLLQMDSYNVQPTVDGDRMAPLTDNDAIIGPVIMPPDSFKLSYYCQHIAHATNHLVIVAKLWTAYAVHVLCLFQCASRHLPKTITGITMSCPRSLR